MIQIGVFKKMIGLDVEVWVFDIKIITDLVFEIDGNGRDTKIGLIEILL